MDRITLNVFLKWHTYIVNCYTKVIKKYRNYRCRIVGLGVKKGTGEIILSVLISGVKNQIIAYQPKELVLDDCMLGEFSPFDARAITFYAVMQEKYENHYLPIYSIAGQQFLNERTIFIIKQLNVGGEIRRSAFELYSNMEILGKFSKVDLVNIVSTAIQEQTIEDLRKIEC